MKHHRTHTINWATLEMGLMPKRPIITNYDFRRMPFPWTATFGEYDLGDPIGIGATEDEAVLDLTLEDDLHESP